MGLFWDLLEIDEWIFRGDWGCERKLEDYMEGWVEKRMKRKEGVVNSGDGWELVGKVNSGNVERNIRRVEGWDNEWDKDCVGLILELDRWNKFRILGREVEEGCGLKRRGNKKEKIYMK